MPTASVATLLVPNGASITNISLVTNKTVSQNQASQSDWTSLHDEAAKVPAMPASSIVPTTARTGPAARSILASISTNPPSEADNFAISAPLASTSHAAIPVAGAVVLNATGNAAPEDSTTSTDNKQVQARSQSTTIVAGGTNTLDGLSALRSLMTTDASSTDAKAYQALTQDISTVLQPAGQPEVLSAPGIQNVDLANSPSGRAAEASSSSAVNQPATPATLTPTSAAAISLPASTVSKTAENAAPEDDTSSPDNKQAQSGNRGKTIVTEGTNTLYGLSAFQSLVAAGASSTDARTYQALAHGNNAAAQPLGQSEILPAAGIQTVDLTNSLSTKASGTSASVEADQPPIPIALIPSYPATSSVVESALTEAAEKTAPGLDTPSSDNKQANAGSQDKTTATDGTNTLYGLSAFQSLVASEASSTDTKAYPALPQGRVGVPTPFGQPEGLSAASVQNIDPTTAIATKGTGASLSAEADRPSISASPIPTPQAAIPVARAVTANSTGNAATGDDTSSPGDERSEAKNQDKTTITAVANAIHGLSEFQFHLTTRASSSSAEIHHALSEGNATPSPAFGRPESPSADAQNATLPNTLSMTVQTEDNTPVRLIFEGEGGLATRVILQSDDDLTTQHLAGNRKELLAALSTAGVDTSAMRLDIVTAPANTSDSHQDSLQQNNAGRSDLAGNFMGSNPQQNQQGSSSNARFWPQEPATETIEQRTAISHSQAETLAPAGGVNITA
ncbi:hypothetical protein HW537_01045 [Asaia siamensis]